jgi:hypothetical protein
MPEWRVECTGEVREVYIVEAETKEVAMANWSSGTLEISEASSVEAVSAEVAE